MSTKSILKNITIKDRNSGESFIEALEKAEHISSKSSAGSKPVWQANSCKRSNKIAEQNL